MSVRDDVLYALEMSRGDAVSGEALASRLGVSRNAVFKAVGILKKNGYGIISTRGGYMLSGDDSTLSVAGIEKHLRNRYNIQLYNEVSSTNTILKSMAENGAEEWTVVVAEKQTAGRGRLGRSFISPGKTGIYTSVLLRPDIPLDKVTLITVAAAVAAKRAIEKVSGKDAMIKWVNDVYIGEKKVCGILTEAAFDAEISKLAYAVLGIGINVALPEGGFGGGVDNIAGAVTDRATAEIRAELIALFLDTFRSFYENGLDGVADEYRKSQYLDGKTIDVERNGKTVSAVAIGVDEMCRLCVKYDDGSEEKLSSGEVSVHLSHV